MRLRTLSAALALFLLVGCGTGIEVTRTTQATYTPTNPDDVEILLTRPEKPYEELGKVTVKDYNTSYRAEMYAAIRLKVAPLGADAVIVTDQGVRPIGGAWLMWAYGVAIRYTSQEGQK